MSADLFETRTRLYRRRTKSLRVKQKLIKLLVLVRLGVNSVKSDAWKAISSRFSKVEKTDGNGNLPRPDSLPPSLPSDASPSAIWLGARNKFFCGSLMSAMPFGKPEVPLMLFWPIPCVPESAEEDRVRVSPHTNRLNRPSPRPRPSEASWPN